VPDPAGKAQPGKAAGVLRTSFIVCAVLIGWFGARAGGPRLAWPVLEFVLGLVAFLQLQAVGLWLAGRVTGTLRVAWQSVGAGRWLGSTTVGGRLLVVRTAPLVLWAPCLVMIAGVPNRRWRMWGGSVARLVVELAAVVACAAAGWWWIAAAGAFLLAGSLGSRPGDPDSRFWMLARLPFGDRHRRLDELTYPSEAAVGAVVAFTAGRFAEARGLLDRAKAEGPVPGSDGTQLLNVESMLLLAEGRYPEAASAATALYARTTTARMRSAAAFRYAGALALGTEAGIWAPAETAPAFRSTLALVPPNVAALGGLTALDRLLAGTPAEAIRPLTRAARFAPDVPSRAQAFCTLAAARALTGDRAGAAKALATAERLTPESPRIGVVRGVTGIAGGGAV
jgi:hypothetical protein